jgi:hypothetical protein
MCRNCWRITLGGLPGKPSNATADLLITRRKVTVTSAVFRRDSLHGTYLRCPNSSSVSGSPLHEWLHAAAKAPRTLAHSDPRSGEVSGGADTPGDSPEVRLLHPRAKRISVRWSAAPMTVLGPYPAPVLAAVRTATRLTVHRIRSDRAELEPHSPHRDGLAMIGIASLHLGSSSHRCPFLGCAPHHREPDACSPWRR